MMRRLTPLLALLVTSGACSSVTEVCPSFSPKLIFVYVRDGATGAYTASGATLVAHSDMSSDSVVAPATAAADTAAISAATQPGVYAVTVRKTGYLTWTRDSIDVRAPGSCANARPVTLEALLQTQF